MDWTQRDSSFDTTTIRKVVYNGVDMWVAVGMSGKLASSPNAIDWTQRDSQFGVSYFRDIYYSINDSLWIGVGSSSKAAKSSNGINWELLTTYFGVTINGIAHNGLSGGAGLWVIVGASGRIRTSPSGEQGTWTPRTNPFGLTAIWDVAHNGLSGGAGLWVAVANIKKIATSPNGITWTLRSNPFGSGDGIEAIAHNQKSGSNGLWVAAADYGKIATSPDGETWTLRDNPSGDCFFRGVDYGKDDYWTAVGSPDASGVSVLSSPDGSKWTSRDAGFGSSEVFGVWHNKLFAEQSLWVAVGEHGKLATSLGFPILYPKKTMWSYGKSVLNNSIKTNITPRWSYGRSTLRQDFIGEQFIRKIVNTIGAIDVVSRAISFARKITSTIGITDTLSRSISFVRSISDTIGILDVLVAIRRNIDSFGTSVIRKIHRMGSPEIKGIDRMESSKIEKADGTGSPEIKGK